MRYVATIEARMTSRRLPGKVLMTAAGKPMLQHLVDRLRRVPSLDEVVIATTINQEDDVLENFASSIGVPCFRGSEDDVMDRVIRAAKFVNSDVIVEITGDCPIIDPEIIEQAVRMFKSNHVDYVSNTHVRSYPDGMDVQVFSLNTLERAGRLTIDPIDREHVTLYIKNHPESFSSINLVAPPEICWPELGLTLDERSDYELLKKIIEFFNEKRPNFSCLEVVRLLREKSEWVQINGNVVRKGNK